MSESTSMSSRDAQHVRRVPELGADLLDLGLEHLEDLALASIIEEEVPDLDLLLLSVAVDAPDPLFEPVRVPGQFVVRHDVAAVLEIDPLTRCVGREQEPRLPVVELVFDPRPFLLVHVAVNHENLVGPRLVLHVLEEVVKRVSVLREQEELLVRLLPRSWEMNRLTF